MGCIDSKQPREELSFEPSEMSDEKLLEIDTWQNACGGFFLRLPPEGIFDFFMVSIKLLCWF